MPWIFQAATANRRLDRNICRLRKMFHARAEPAKYAAIALWTIAVMFTLRPRPLETIGSAA